MYIRVFHKLTDMPEPNVTFDDWAFNYYCKCGAHCFWSPYADDPDFPGDGWAHADKAGEGCAYVVKATPVLMVY